jgi:exodeoxyribonuclease V alpha subunit
MTQKTSQAPKEQLHGTVKLLTYVNPENGYFVARVEVEGKGEKTVIGNAPMISVGEHISAHGNWQASNWGPQFKAREVTLSAPTMLSGIEKYLANAVEGIGKTYAKKLVGAFGEDVFNVIENSPEKLNDVKGIGKKRAASIIEAYSQQKAIREIMVFLHRNGLSTSRAKRVFDKYGDTAIAAIQENPYRLCADIWGIGFGTADDVARKQGILPNSEYRVRAGIQHVLVEASGQGSCGLPVDIVREKASELLGVDYDTINLCMGYELEAGTLVKDFSDDIECLYLPRVYYAEKFISECLLRHAARVPNRALKDVDQYILDAEVEIGIVLEEAQREAVRVALMTPICVLTGGPGTGKTTITRVLLKVFEDNGLSSIRVCAPTGKAAKRAAEATGFEATTIHRTLEVLREGGFKFNETNPLTYDVLVIDEMSMVDVSLMLAVCKALTGQTRLILVGDVDQLPSVGPGKVLADIIRSGAIPTVWLKAVFRQAATSDIVKNAHAINRGEMPVLGYKEGSDFCFTHIAPKDKASEESKKECRATIEAEVLRLCRDMYRLGYDPIKDVQVLAPMRRGILGVESLNARLQTLLNPSPSAVLEFFGTKWGVGDKVMQLRNNYDKSVFNGDIGFIVEVEPASHIVAVNFEGHVVTYKASELDELSLAYAFTIHKSQGSEFPVVVMPVDWSHFTMLKRNLLYTGITRARKLCVMVGQPTAVAVAVRTPQIDERYSRLKDWLKAGLPRELRGE